MSELNMIVTYSFVTFFIYIVELKAHLLNFFF